MIVAPNKKKLKQREREKEKEKFLTWPTTSTVFHGERTRKLSILGPLELLPPINHFRKGNNTPAISNIDVKVFSRISAATYDAYRMPKEHVDYMNISNQPIVQNNKEEPS